MGASAVGFCAAGALGGSICLYDTDISIGGYIYCSSDGGITDIPKICFKDTAQVDMTDTSNAWIEPSTGASSFASVTVGTLTISDGSIDDTDGSIAFGDTNFTGVGTIACGIISAGRNVIAEWANDTAISMPGFVLRRLRDGDPTSNVANGDYLGQLMFQGYHTDGYDVGARVQAIVDGDPGDGDMPTRLEFLTTPDGSDTPLLALTLDSSQNATFAGTLGCGAITATLTASKWQLIDDTTSMSILSGFATNTIGTDSHTC